jgi:hypothetical protein
VRMYLLRVVHCALRLGQSMCSRLRQDGSDSRLPARRGSQDRVGRVCESRTWREKQKERAKGEGVAVPRMVRFKHIHGQTPRLPVSQAPRLTHAEVAPTTRHNGAGKCEVVISVVASFSIKVPPCRYHGRVRARGTWYTVHQTALSVTGGLALAVWGSRSSRRSLVPT